MVGKTFTYLLGSEAATLMFNSKNEDLNAEDVYSKLTTPVFGRGVAYDVPNPVSHSDVLESVHTGMIGKSNCLMKMDSSTLFADLPGAKEDAEDRTEHCTFQRTCEDHRGRDH